MKDYPKSVEQIRRYIARMLPFSTISTGGGPRELRVSVGKQGEVLSLDETMLEDLEAALQGGQPARYINGQVRDATLRTLIKLGQRGMAPHVVLSNQLINEDLDWTGKFKCDTEFQQETAVILKRMLVDLRNVADKMLRSGESLPDVQQERDILHSLVSFFEQHQHLDSRGVSAESLGYLKAAAFLWIREIESAMRAERSERVKIQRSIKYFEVIDQFWLRRPFDRVPLPRLLHDLVAYEGDADRGNDRGELGPSINVGALLRQVDPRLEARWQGAWDALKSDNPDNVSQAANSMVEVLDQVINYTCQGREFRDVLAERYSGQEDVVLKKRAYIGSLKSTLHSVKHETNSQPRSLAEDLFHAVEGIVRTLLRE